MKEKKENPWMLAGGVLLAIPALAFMLLWYVVLPIVIVIGLVLLVIKYWAWILVAGAIGLVLCGIGALISKLRE